MPLASSSAYVTLAQTISNECQASGAALFSDGSGVELGSWNYGPGERGRLTEFTLCAGLSLRIRNMGKEPAAGTLRMTEIALRVLAENETLQATAKRHVQQAQASLEVNREICGSGGLDQVLLLVAQLCRTLLQCELAGVALLDATGSSIRWPAMSGARTDAYLHAVYTADGGVAGKAIGTGRPIIVEDFGLDPTLTPQSNPISFAEGLRAILAVPLDIADRPRGCLMIGYRATHRFSQEEVSVLKSFASQAAIAVENAELYANARRGRARMQSLVESIDEGLILVDNEGSIALINRRAEDIFRATRDSIVGLPLSLALDELGRCCASPSVLRAAIFDLIDAAGAFPARDIPLRSSPLLQLRVTAFRVYDPEGVELGRGFLCRDVTFEFHVDTLKSDVIAIVSHEIRSPLASIRGCASALLDTERTRSEQLQRTYLETMDRESARLTELVSNLTDVSLLDAGVLKISPCASDPIVLLERVIERKRGERVIRLDGLPVMRPLLFDHYRIEQVIDNLLENAIKYSPASSEIDVRTTDWGDDFVVSVTDRGVGIPRQLREHIFERFYRIEGLRRKGDGCGLGLYICRGIVEAHGGRIWLDPSVERGTCICFSLPRMKVNP
jgi:signal transduction histidine kinase